MHLHGTISPFDTQKRVHILHCQLNKHHLSSAYCPHSTTLKNKEKSVIALDCNGRTSGTLPVVSSYITSVFLSANVLCFSKYPNGPEISKPVKLVFCFKFFVVFISLFKIFVSFSMHFNLFKYVSCIQRHLNCNSACSNCTIRTIT